MKANLKRLFALFLAVSMLFALCVTAHAESPDRGWYDDSEWYDSDYDPGVFVYFPDYELDVKVGEELKVKATVLNAGNNAVYEWRSSEKDMVKFRKEKDTAYITGLKTGHTKITLTVTTYDGSSSDFDFFELDVIDGVSSVTAMGGGYYTLKAGESLSLTAYVSGGSGSYVYEWDTNGTAALTLSDKNRNNARVYAGSAGSGTVFLTVYDELDYSNNDTVQWDFTVDSIPSAQSPSIELSRGTIDIGAGGKASLSAAAYGGSGNYTYTWRSDNPGIVSVVPNGANAQIQATSTLLPGANTAQISVTARDNQTGLVSNTATCIVVVTGQSTVFDYMADAQIGVYLRMNKAAEEIDTVARVDFSKAVNSSATIKFETPSTGVGSLRMADGSVVRSGTNYTFDQFRKMLFYGAAAGSFNSNYRIVDGGFIITGKISIGVNGGGVGVTNVSMSASTLEIPTYSSQYIRVNVIPNDATSSVAWRSADPRIVSVNGSGNQCTLTTGGLTGKAMVVATVTDARGTSTEVSCSVTVKHEVVYDPTVHYDINLSLTLGSDYYGTKLADSMSNKYKSVFGAFPAESDTIKFSKLGNNRYGTMYLRNGALAEANRTYTFRDWIDMYFVPSAAGIYELGYEFSHGTNIMRGTIMIVIQGASVNVTMSPTALQMSPFSSQYVTLAIEPSSRAYRVTWTSSDNSVAPVTGSNTTAVINSVNNGTAVITAIVTDSLGVEVRRSCSVMVNSTGSTFNPSVSTTLGIPYVGTGTSSAMRSQFLAVYGITLQDNATIRFSSTGNNDVGVMRLADGSMIRPNTDYTLAQYVAMYTQPVAAGTYSVPYVLSFAGKSLSGTVSVIVNPANISTGFTLTSGDPYLFSNPLNGSSGAAIFADSIRNSAGANWGYIRINNTYSSIGTLYLDKNLSQLTPTTNITPQAVTGLYFVPGSEIGTFNVPYTVYAGTGAVVGTGTLSISRTGITFNDVPADAYYAQAVAWAVNKGITSGTGGNNFSPDMTVTRGQAVTFLWRAAGQPKAAGAVNPFNDVIAGAYYYDAVLWAVQQGITQGTGETTFSPDNPLNRDQLLTFLCRSNGGYAGGAQWSQLAVDWANKCDLLAGVPGVFVADSACPRCDVVYYLWKNYNS